MEDTADIYRDMVQHADRIILRLDMKGFVRFANEAVRRILGREPSALLGTDAFGELIGDRGSRENLVEVVLAADTTETRKESSHLRPDGRLVWIDWRLKPLLNNETPGILCEGADITHERYDRERYRVLFEESKDMIYACTPDGSFTEINPAGVQLLGCKDASELIGRNIVEFYVSDRDREYYNERIRDNGFVQDLELVMRRSDGSEVFVLETSSAIRSVEGKILELRGIVKDITDRIQSEKRQMQMNIKLSDANRKLKMTQSRLVQQEKLASIGQLAAGVAHEINNPLGFVKSNFGSLKRYIEEMRSYLASLEEGIRTLSPQEGEDLITDRRRQTQLEFILEDIESIFEESSQGFDRIVAIVRGLRNFSRMDAGGKTAQYDLNSAIADALVMARNELKYVADVEQDLGDIPPVQCRADEINQVLLNIIVNAAQAIKEAGYEERRPITVRTWSDSRWVICEITDSGPGMPQKVQSRIFDPFFTTKEIGRGTGLGLSISYDIVVNRHGGDLSVRSDPGKGSTFTIKLPRTQAGE